MIAAALATASLATASLALAHLAHPAVLANIALDPGGILAWVIAGLLAGWLAGLLVRGRGFGCIGDIAIGLLGAFVGAFLLSFVPITITGISGFVETLVVAFLGALALVALGRLIGGPRRTHHSRPRYPNPRYYNPYQPPRGPYGQP